MRRNILCVLIITLLFFTYISRAHADSFNQEDDDSDIESEVEVEMDDFQASIHSKFENVDHEAEFEVDLEIASSIKVKAEYKSESGSVNTDTEISNELFDVIEFTDNNSNGKYDESDTIVKEIKLEQDLFDPLIYTQIDQGSASEHLLRLNAKDGSMSFVFHIATTNINVSGVYLKPTEIKIDYIYNHTFADNQSLLALRSEIRSSLDIEENEESPDEQAGVAENESAIYTDSQISSYFAWKEVAEVDNEVRPVNTTLVKSEPTRQEVYFTYPQGSSIVHDPSMGVQLPSQSNTPQNNTTTKDTSPNSSDRTENNTAGTSIKGPSPDYKVVQLTNLSSGVIFLAAVVLLYRKRE